MSWANAGIIFTALIHCPFFIWFVIAIGIAAIFMGKDPVFKESEVE